MSACCATANPIQHPLAPLSPQEISQAATLTKTLLGSDGLRFEMIELKEPDKKTVRNFSPDTPIDRLAMVNVYKLGQIGVWRVLISLTENTVLAETFHEAARPMIQLEEFEEIENIVKQDPRFIEACAKRGITDLSLVCVDPWSAGNFGMDGEDGKHLSHGFCWVRSSATDNLYAHPIEGLNPIVDIKNQCLLRLDDYGVVPIPEQDVNFGREFQTDTRTDLQAINVVQPEGVTFAIEGNTLKWHDWSILIGFNAREGITLHNIQLAGRSILYRASLAEMVVPYGSPKVQHARKNVFDIGEYGLGKMANALSLGCDCLGVIHYLDCWISDINGEPQLIKNAICIHEEDHGIAWKHWDFRTDRAEVRRNRRLVISSISTVGNYEYGSYWYFYLDGTIEFEMKATGIINTVGKIAQDSNHYGTEVTPGVIGQMHQHLFCARLDLAIDGDANNVFECNTVAEPIGADNVFGNAFYVQETPLTEECGRSRNPDSERYWKFASSERNNGMGTATAYKLEPSHAVKVFVDQSSPSGKRMPFVYNHLWLTRYNSEERYPAGQFMNHSDGSEGLHQWVKRKGSLNGQDIVAWYVFGLHHNPRLEDFPVQPVVSTGFKLMANGFFDRNPNLDLPPDTNEASRHALAEQ